MRDLAGQIAETVALFEVALEMHDDRPEEATATDNIIARGLIEFADRMERMPADFDSLSWERQRALLIADYVAGLEG